MGAELAVAARFEEFSQSDLREIDGDLRMSHVALARLAKMSQPLVAARLVRRHWEWLNKISRVATVANRPENGGREWEEYFLTRDHCIYLLAKSDMPEANDLTVYVVQVFSKALRGELSIAPRMELRALEVAAQHIVAPILAEQRTFHEQVLTRMDRTEGRVRDIETKVGRIEEASTRFMDRPFTLRTRRIHAAVVESQYNGMCPCCRTVKIIENGARLPECNDEHFCGRQKNRLHQTWITCAGCNQKLRDVDFHGLKYGAFLSYQDALRYWQAESHKQSLLF
jgi:hypothetical protein